MRPHTIRYRIRPDARDEHERLLSELLAALATTPVPGLRYEAFRIGDGPEYLHLINYDKAGHGPLNRPAAFAHFHDTMRERCDGDPRRDELNPVLATDAPSGGDADQRDHHDRWHHLHD